MSEPTGAYSSYGMILASPIRYDHNDFMSSDELSLPCAQGYDPTENTDQSTHGQNTSTYANINFMQQCPDIGNASPGGSQPLSIYGYHQVPSYPNKAFQYLSRGSQNLSNSVSSQAINCHHQTTSSQTTSNQTTSNQTTSNQTTSNQTTSNQTTSNQTTSNQTTSSSSLQANHQQANNQELIHQQVDVDYTTLMLFGGVGQPRTTESSASSCHTNLFNNSHHNPAQWKPEIDYESGIEGQGTSYTGHNTSAFPFSNPWQTPGNTQYNTSGFPLYNSWSAPSNSQYNTSGFPLNNSWSTPSNTQYNASDFSLNNPALTLSNIEHNTFDFPLNNPALTLSNTQHNTSDFSLNSDFPVNNPWASSNNTTQAPVQAQWNSNDCAWSYQ
ncbi:hypothetical protein EAF04_003537 [Stromatinia cepivora]|nr:hypothetical protein EAF04_003537 [Stromatinia cepivora]